MYISNDSNVILKYLTCRFLLIAPVVYCPCSATDHLCQLLKFINDHKTH